MSGWRCLTKEEERRRNQGRWGGVLHPLPQACGTLQFQGAWLTLALCPLLLAQALGLRIEAGREEVATVSLGSHPGDVCTSIMSVKA